MFSAVPLCGIPRNAEFLYGIGISRNSAKFREILYSTVRRNSAEIHGIPYRFVYMEFRIPSNGNSIVKKLKKSTKRMVYIEEFRKGLCILNSVYLQISSVLDRLKNKSIKKINPLKLNYAEFRYTKGPMI